MQKMAKDDAFYLRLREQLMETSNWPGAYMFKFIVPTSSKEYNNFELRKALGVGNTAQAFKIVHFFGLQPKQHPLLGTINSLYKFFMQLLTYHGLPSQNPDAVAKALGINPFFVREIEQAARRYPLKSIVPILGTIKEADLAAKGVNAVPMSESEALQQLLSKIT